MPAPPLSDRKPLTPSRNANVSAALPPTRVPTPLKVTPLFSVPAAAPVSTQVLSVSGAESTFLSVAPPSISNGTAGRADSANVSEPPAVPLEIDGGATD